MRRAEFGGRNEEQRHPEAGYCYLLTKSSRAAVSAANPPFTEGKQAAPIDNEIWLVWLLV